MFLEHEAHDRVSGRPVIILDRGPLGFLFLNNNVHVVHDMHHTVAWHRLWPLYLSQRERVVAGHQDYGHARCAKIFRLYLWSRKDAVAHPLWRGGAE